jgi:acyl-CoA dehydrogenase
MDFAIPERTRAIVEQVRAILQAEVMPLEREMHRGFKAVEPRLRSVRERVRAAGLLTPQMPREAGGGGLSLTEHAVVSEELGRTPLGHFAFNCQAPDAGNMEILWQFGTDAQKERFLRPLVRGDIRSCFAMTEPERPGSNPTWMETRAVRDGNEWVIDGHKWFTTGADGATFAVVMAVTDPEAPRHLRASQILVPCDTPGFQLVRNVPVMGHPGEGWASHGEIRFTGCRVSAENLLGERGAGFTIAQERLGPGRIHHCMRWIGICERSFDLLCNRSAMRELSPGKPLGTKQMVQEWIAESRAEINAARLMVLQAAWKIERHGASEAREEISLIKFYVANVMLRVIDRAIQAHGALGVTDDTPLAWYWREERAARIYDGADEVHKAAVARRILRRYGLEVG